ncbi:CCA tRNA nucleotidyltransferase [Erysipelotrichaceae bacterium RD49]|nr:CCA tRNA nucleotidyltransferase [Erysipelotrichaceae bacterium RD49]
MEQLDVHNSQPLFLDLPNSVKDVMETLEKHGFEAYLVGGCVRDALPKNKPHDFDLTTSARPEQVMELFDKTIPTGIAHGTVTVMTSDGPVEVTTFRKEGEYRDHRHPDFVDFVGDIKEDLARRDFTINAMAWNPKTGLVDPFGGRQDLQKGIVRAVGDPSKRFEEDALRMLRAYRFAGRYGFDLDPKTREAIQALAPTIANVAVERVVEEVQQILLHSPAVLDQMTKLLEPWIPELDQMLHTEQNSVYHYTDVLHHTIDALKHLPNSDPACAWALLLHDTGKPKTRQFYNGHDHFKRHEVESEKIAKRVVKALKLPRKMSEQIVNLVRYHDTFYAPKLENLYKIRVVKGWDDQQVEKLFDVQYGDIMAHATHDRLKNLNAFKEFYQREKKLRPLSVKDLQINGEDVLANTPLQGRQISKALGEVLHAAITRPNLETRAAQLALLKQTASQIQKEEK